MRTANPMISVVIPVYNAEKFLARCINSVCIQTCGEWELILVNDGSTDDSASICNQYAQADDRIQVIHQVNQGVSCARNRGIKAAIGKYITFVDSDDYIENNMVEDFVGALNQSGAETLFSGSKIHKHTKAGKSVTTSCSMPSKAYSRKELLEAMDRDFDHSFIFGPVSKCYSLNLIIENKIEFPPELTMAEDTWFNIYVVRTANTFVTLNGLYYNVDRINENSLSSKYRSSALEISQKVFVALRELMLKEHCSDNAIKEMNYIILTNLLGAASEKFRFPKLTTFRQRTDDIKLLITTPIFMEAAQNCYTKTPRDKLVLFLVKHKQVSLLYILLRLYCFLKGYR